MEASKPVRPAETRIAGVIKLLGGLAAAGAILVQLSGIQDSLDRNCDATANSLRTVRAVVRIDDELSRPRNAALKRLLLSDNGVSC